MQGVEEEQEQSRTGGATTATAKEGLIQGVNVLFPSTSSSSSSDEYEEATERLLKEHPQMETVSASEQQQHHQVAEKIKSRRKLEQLSGHHEQQQQRRRDEGSSLSTASTLQMSDTLRSKWRIISKDECGQKEEEEEVVAMGGFSKVRKLSARWLNELFHGAGGNRGRGVATFECDNSNSNNDILLTGSSSMNPRWRLDKNGDLDELQEVRVNDQQNMLSRRSWREEQEANYLKSRSSCSGNNKTSGHNSSKQKKKKMRRRRRMTKKKTQSNYNCNSSVNSVGNGGGKFEGVDTASDDFSDNNIGQEEDEEEVAGRLLWLSQGEDFNSNSSGGRKYEALPLHPLHYQTHTPHPQPPPRRPPSRLGHHHHHRHYPQRHYREQQCELTRFCEPWRNQEEQNQWLSIRTTLPGIVGPAVESTTAGRKYREEQRQQQLAELTQQQLKTNKTKNRFKQRREKNSSGNANMSDSDNSSGNDEWCNVVVGCADKKLFLSDHPPTRGNKINFNISHSGLSAEINLDHAESIDSNENIVKDTTADEGGGVNEGNVIILSSGGDETETEREDEEELQYFLDHNNQRGSIGSALLPTRTKKKKEKIELMKSGDKKFYYSKISLRE